MSGVLFGTGPEAYYKYRVIDEYLIFVQSPIGDGWCSFLVTFFLLSSVTFVWIAFFAFAHLEGGCDKKRNGTGLNCNCIQRHGQSRR